MCLVSTAWHLLSLLENSQILTLSHLSLILQLQSHISNVFIISRFLFCPFLYISHPLSITLCGLVAKSCPTLMTMWTLSPPGSSILCPWNFPWKNAGGELPFPSPVDLQNSGIETGSALQADSLLIEAPGKPQFTNFIQSIYATENIRFYIFSFGIFKCLEFIFHWNFITIMGIT